MARQFSKGGFAMSGKWTAVKNICWALAIAVCLLALIVGLVITTVNRYNGSSFSNSTEIKSEGAANGDVTQLTQGSGGGMLLTLDETNDAGQEYIDSLTFLCDSSFIGVRDYGLLTGGADTTQVWGTSTGTLRVADLPNATIVYPSDKSDITIADAAMVAKPSILVIIVGQDGLTAVDKATFVASYAAMINNIKSASPDTKIICCSISSIGSDYSGSDSLTTIAVSDANDWIKEVCQSTGVYFTDSGKSVGDGTGAVLNSYLSANGKTLNSSGINEVLEYLRTHALS